jgi:hypothetical protein
MVAPGAIVGITNLSEYYSLPRGEDLTLRADLHIVSASANVEFDWNGLVFP